MLRRACVAKARPGPGRRNHRPAIPNGGDEAPPSTETEEELLLRNTPKCGAAVLARGQGKDPAAGGRVPFRPASHVIVRSAFWGLLLLGMAPVSAKTYLSQEQALALAFEKPAEAHKHEIAFDDTRWKELEKQLGEKVSQRGLLAWTGALKEGGGHGVAIFDSVTGKHELIDYMTVLDEQGKVRFIEILAYRESQGGEVRREQWRKQFAGKSPEDPPVHDKNIVNISGATLSCRHVTDGVRRLLVVAQVYADELGIKPTSK